jgi:hypothetical protein
MGNPVPTAGGRGSVAAQLRQALLAHFDTSDLETLCFDLGIDYDALPGDGRAAKVVELIEHFARTGRIVELIDYCAGMRANVPVPWAELRAAAVANPALFQSVAPDRPATGGGQLLNAPTDRALKIGIAIGVLAVLLLLCGFSGGLLASQFVTVTVNPVQPSREAFVSASVKLNGALSGRQPEFVYSNEEATSLATALLVSEDSPISEIHIRFLESGDTSINAPFRAWGGMQVVVGLGVQAVDGRLVLTPKAAAVNVLGLRGTTFGWVAVPTAVVQAFVNWLQQRLDEAASMIWFESIEISRDRMQVRLHPR